MNGLELLKLDHRKVEKLFTEFKDHSDLEKKKEIANEIIKELSIHAAIEEEWLYPIAKEVLRDKKDQVDESLEEHAEAKRLLAEIGKLQPSEHDFILKVMELKKAIEHHVEEEEGDLFPKLQLALSEDILVELGEHLEKAKARAPTRPHPRAPDEPPLNKIAGAFAGLLDRVRDRIAKR